MWMTQDDARSDFVLAAAPAVLYQLVAGELVPRVLGSFARNSFLQAALLFAFTGLAPLWLARYRGQGAAAFGLDKGREGLVAGFSLAAVFLGVHLVYGLGSDLGVLNGALGVFVGLRTTPTVGGGLSLVDAVGLLALVVARVAGTVLLTTFLTTRARHAFRELDMSRVEALRTYGMATAAGLGLLGVLLALGPNRLLFTLGPAVGAALVVLLADRLVEPGVTSSRWTMIAPGIVLVLVEVGVFGLLRDPLDTLFTGGLIFVTALVASVLVETQRHAWAVVPMLAASVVWPLLRFL